MSVSKFNELGSAAMSRVASRDLNQEQSRNLGQNPGNSADSMNAHPAARAGVIPGNNPAGRPGTILGAGVDWFSQLESGTSHPMKASNQFGSNPPIDTIVDSILSNLGLHPGPE